jgi:hypothetical protein
MTEEEINAVLDNIDSAMGSQQQTPASVIAAIEKLADPAVNSILEALPDVRQKELIELVRKRRASLSLGSSTKTEIVGICKQILAFGAAGIGLSIGFSDKFIAAAPAMQKVIVIGAIFYLEIMFVSLLVMLVYTMQARFRYPSLYFSKIGNAWPYFYYASISEGIPRQTWQTKKKLLTGAKLYAQDFLRFSSKVATEGTAAELRAEVQQYYLLLSYQGYAHQFSLRLANLFFYGFAGAFLTLVVLAVWAVIV